MLCPAKDRPHFGRFTRLAAAAVIVPVLLVTFAAAQSGRATIKNNTPKFVSTAKNLGAETGSKMITVTLGLKGQNQPALDQLVRQMYDPNSHNYHRWLTHAQVAAHFAPSRQEAEIVKKALETENLTVIGSNNFTVRARGTVADVQRAFNVRIDKFQVNGKIYRSNTSDPQMPAPAASLVATITGLSDFGFQPHSIAARDPETGIAYPAVPISSNPNGVFFEGQCFRPPQTKKFSSSTASATYTGNRYGADITNGQLGHLPPCGYSPAELQTAYGLNAVYAHGFSGTGQTIVIVDAYGSPTIAADANVFSQIYGLPSLDSSNFQIYYPDGAPTETNTGWATETTLDVEWAHAVAPDAKIALIIVPDNSFGSLEDGVIYAIVNGLGNVISNSYGAPEVLFLPDFESDLDFLNFVNEVAASLGISVHYSTGDDGDFSFAYGTASVSVPANLPFSTAVGGTSLAINNGAIKFQTGWGTTITRIADRIDLGSPPVVPPMHAFSSGAGGGASAYFAKPSYQSNLPGDARLLPDISWLADPYTGAEIICDGASCGIGPAGDEFVEVLGGTSLACPMFSGLWAIANQKAGTPLGAAAPILYGLPAGAITDVLPVGSPTDVKGTIVSSAGRQTLSPADLSAPLFNTTTFYNALYNSPTSTRWFVVGFGIDTSLTTAPGWDNVTGLGTPNGWSFIKAIAAP